MAGFAGQTAYTLTLSFMQQICGMPVAVEPNLTFTPGSWFDNSINQQDVVSMGNGKSGGGGSLYMNVGYSTPPVPTNADCYSVITGVQMVVVGNRLRLSVQFSTLDLSNPANPAIYSQNWATAQWGRSFFATYGWDSWPQDVNYIDLLLARHQ